MIANKLLFCQEVGKLKDLTRQGWVLRGIFEPEKVAAHMYRMATMAMALKPVENCNMDKVVKLCLIHDIAEGQVGDLTPYDGVSDEEKHRRERKAVDYLGSLLPEDQGKVMINYYTEYEERLTPESRLTKDLDRFDMVLQAFEYEKKEFDLKGSIPNLQEFYDITANKFENQEIKELLQEIYNQRKDFLSSRSQYIREI